ncbi:hypothetical protein EOS_17065 [Caballeronia mineralivorans PML1(12)]|uniref:Transposase IS66 C-terminal domain-containing protein n=1 Tax=Caballeronia mineralivorans PML1(12) TaxID=908627 RepID=A0A0J1CWP9_9BURK|nr:hypothetical protein EOS_17065 [Caballeronia mineralivorans PML1(12)]
MHCRRNYLFAGADSDGERAAAIYSFIGTAKLNDVDPEAYLRFGLARIADHAITALTNSWHGSSWIGFVQTPEDLGRLLRRDSRSAFDWRGRHRHSAHVAATAS